jgi:hypothetical protein
VIDPALGSQLADLGGFALFLLTVVTVAVGLHRQWWVPGWIYRAVEQRADKAEVQAMRNAESLEKLARAVTGERNRRHVQAPEAGNGPG